MLKFDPIGTRLTQSSSCMYVLLFDPGHPGRSSRDSKSYWGSSRGEVKKPRRRRRTLWDMFPSATWHCRFIEDLQGDIGGGLIMSPMYPNLSEL